MQKYFRICLIVFVFICAPFLVNADSFQIQGQGGQLSYDVSGRPNYIRSGKRYVPDKWDDGYHNGDGHPYNQRSNNRRNSRDYNSRHGGGHWEIVSEYVHPVTKPMYREPYYTSTGRYMPGAYEQVEISDGYYRDKRVWVQD